MSEQGALAAAAAAHDDEDIAMVDREVEIAHEHEAAVGHREIAHGDVRTSHGCFPIAWECLPAMSDPQDVENDGEDAAGDDNGDDPGDHGGCRRIADGGGAVAALHAPQTAGKRDQHAVDRALEDAAENIRQADRIRGLAKISGPGEIQHADTDGSPAQHTDEIGVKAQQRHHQD